jgi:phage antirepressor YoqD-like protein
MLPGSPSALSQTTILGPARPEVYRSTFPMSDMSNSPKLPTIAIGDVNLSIVTVNRERLVTLGMVDQVHKRPDGTARRNFNTHRARLTEGQHYLRMSADEIRTRFPGLVSDRTTEDVTLLTERGYLMLVKSFTDDLAWEVQDKLVESYFKTAGDSPNQAALLSDPASLRILLLQNVEKVIDLQGRLADQAPKVQAFDRIASTEGSHCLTDAAKLLQMRRTDLEKELHARDWIYRRAGNGRWHGKSTKEQQGLVTHKYTSGRKADGTEWTDDQVRLTLRGLAKIAVILGRSLDEAA